MNLWGYLVMPEPGVGELEVDHGAVLLVAVLLEFCVALDEGLEEMKKEAFHTRGQMKYPEFVANRESGTGTEAAAYQCCDSNQ